MKTQKNIETYSHERQAADPARVTDADRRKAENHYQVGRELWAAGDRSGAMSEYSKAVALDPDSKAATALKMAGEIMDFFDRSRYNP